MNPYISITRPLAVALVVGASAAVACGQGLERRVSGVGDGAVAFHFASRGTVCGNGRSFLRIEEDGFYGNWNESTQMEPCAAGPVRVVVVRAGREIIKIETYAGPLRADTTGAHELGAVPARDAAAYLMTLAATLDGRPAREAILPAVLADSAVVTPSLAAIVKDQGRSRETRRSAISWLARRRNEAGGIGAAAADRALDQLVRDRAENETVRSAALSTVARLDRGDGILPLMAFAATPDAWLSRKAFSSLASSGDPRARQFLRDALKRSDLSEEQRTETIRGLGNEYGAASDIAIIRGLYPQLNSDRERDAVISTIVNAGGTENMQWLLGIAKSPTEPMQRRRKVLSQLGRLDDPRVRDALKEMIEK